MKVTLTKGPDIPIGYLLVAEDGQSALVQEDWSYPNLAGLFGWAPCDCGFTDGTVDCDHKTASQMITAAADVLREHRGDTVEDQEYFEVGGSQGKEHLSIGREDER